jgi:hypothetical protein
MRASDTGTLYIFDPRLVTLDNTLDNPTNYATTTFQSCPTVPKTFLNKVTTPP